MRFFGFPRLPSRSAVQSQDSAVALEAFAAEDAPSEPVRPAAPASAESRLRRLMVLLAAVAIIEAVPAALWVHRMFVSPADAAVTPSAVQPQPPVPSLVATAPCEAPAPAARSDNSREKRATTGRPAASASAPAASGLIAGFVSIAAPVPMHVYNNNRLVGTTEAETLMLPIGKHDLEFVSEPAGYRTRETVTVQTGKTAKVTLEAPAGTVHVNATPWAEVLVDNRRVGETPIGNLKLPIGNRTFVFRHPELGEHRATVLVTLKETVRVSVDMRKK